MDRNKPGKGLSNFTKDVLYAALVSVTAQVLGWAALLVLGSVVALIVTGWKVPAWTLPAMALVALALVYLTKRVAGREAAELRPKLAAAEDKLDRHGSYGSNICSALDTFQRIVSKDIKNMSMGTFIERGVLIPARDVMQANGHPSDLRMSVLLEVEGRFKMIWASGHSVQSQEKYDQQVDKTISKVAFDKKLPQVWKDAPEEERSFITNPHASRGFKSMVSIPILLGDKTAGVFNIVTDRRDAFDPADVNYLTSLGSIVQLAFGLALKELRQNDKRPSPSPQAATATGRAQSR